MDLFDVASLVAAPAPRLRLRKGTVVSVQGPTITVTIAGSAVEVAGVKYLSSCCPVPAAGVWLATDGIDLFALGTMTPVGAPYSSIERTNDGTLATGTWYALSFASNTRTDPWGMWTSGAPDLITVPVPGIYAIDGSAMFAANSTGGRDVGFLRNSAAIATDMRPPRPGVATQVHLHTVYPLSAGDQIQLRVRQSSGANLSVLAGGPDGIRLAVQWLRPPT